MAQIIHAVILYLIFNTGPTESKKSRDRGKEISFEKQLHKDLMADYDSITAPPSNKSEPFTVHVSFILRSFEFTSQEEVLSLYAWMFISWTDERLKWDPAKYGGITKTHMTSLHIWIPMFRLYNSADEIDYDRFFYALCKLNYRGKVMCVPRTMHETVCSVKLTNWPYDRQKCSVIYGAYHERGTVNLSFSNDIVLTTVGGKYGAEWTILDCEQIENQNSEKQLEMIFTLEREAQTLAALIIYPTYILIALTLGTLWLDVRCDIRLHLICFSLFCHYYLLSELGRNIPKESEDSPTIILFYRGLEILTVLVLLLTIVLRGLCKKVSRPFDMINSIDDFVHNGYGKYLVFTKWESENGRVVRLGEDDFGKDWTTFANILNSICIIVIIVVYICLFFVLMPQPYPTIN